MKTPDELRAAIETEGGPYYEEGKKQVEKILSEMEKTGSNHFCSCKYCGVEAQRILRKLGYSVIVESDRLGIIEDVVYISIPKAAESPREQSRKPWWRFWA